MTAPTVLIRMADAGDLYMYWRWQDGTDDPGATVIPAAQVDTAAARVRAALPDPARPGGLAAALRTGAFADFAAEDELAQELSRVFLPYALAVQLYGLYQRGVRPRLRIQPSPRVAQIPWELLAPEPLLRLLDIAEIDQLAPAAVVHGPGRIARNWDDCRELPVVAVLDPRVPGFRADSALGSVLGRMTADQPLVTHIDRYRQRDRLRPAISEPLEAFRRTDLDRDWLGRTLRAGASRLLYVGHVSAAALESGQSETARLHLACTDGSIGFAAPERTHRPLSAKDLILGTYGLDTAGTSADMAEMPGDTTAPGSQTSTGESRSGPRLWPIPPRVALIACESGGDLRFGEPLGLVAAMVHGGAELVTASRWALPTDLAYQRLAGVADTVRPLQDAVRAIDSAHERADPVTALATWQRERLAAWRDSRSIADSPLSWAAFATVRT